MALMGVAEPVPSMVSLFSGGWSLVPPGAVDNTQPTSGSWESSNLGVWFPIYVPATCVAKRNWWVNGSTVNAGYLVEAGLYLDAGGKPGARLGTTGVVQQGTASQIQFSNFGRAYALALGVDSGSSSDLSAYTTGTASFTSGLTYLLAFAHTKASSADEASSVASSNVTFTSRGSVAYGASSEFRVSLWSATSTYTGSEAITITFPATQTSIRWSLTALYNVDSTTNDGVVQAVTNSGNDTTPTCTLSAFAATSNITFAAISNALSSTTPGSGFRELNDGSISTPTVYLQTEYEDSNDTTPDGTVTSGYWGIVGAEIKAATQPTYTLAPGRYWLYMSCSTASATFFRTSAPGQFREAYKFQQASIGPGSSPATATPVEATGQSYYLFGFSTNTVT
jgi:hypothetical protein